MCKFEILRNSNFLHKNRHKITKYENNHICMIYIAYIINISIYNARIININADEPGFAYLEKLTPSSLLGAVYGSASGKDRLEKHGKLVPKLNSRGILLLLKTEKLAIKM